MKKIRIVALFSLGLLSFLPIVEATELPEPLTLNLDSGPAEIEKFRDYSEALGASPWIELASLGPLGLELVQALRLGDAEGFVAKKAVMDYRVARLSGDLRLELLRAQLEGQCSCPQSFSRSCDGGELEPLPPAAWAPSPNFPPVLRILTVPEGEPIESCADLHEGAICAEFTNGVVIEASCCIEASDVGSQDLGDCIQVISLIRDTRA